MATLVVGASGATGKLLVKQLLKSGESVKIIVRTGSKLNFVSKVNTTSTCR